jgi:thiamine biosynthesis lipoprotein
MALAAVLACMGCGAHSPARARVPEFSGPTMGTVYKVKVVLPEPGTADPATLQGLIAAELDHVNALMSTFRPDSELSRFNAHASTSPFPLSAPTFEVFQLALGISEQTGGVFDITVGPLVNAWGFGPDSVPATPLSDAEVASLLAHTGYGKLTLDPDNLTVSKADPEVYCDLSAIAKGYAVDRVGLALEEAGFFDYMAEVGGEVRTRGLNAEGQPWRIGIVCPDPTQGGLEQIVPLSGWSLATSGDYRNFYERDGVRYSHTIDPRTGRPITHNLASASVIHTECALADGYATALMVMGPEDALRWCEEHDVIAFLIVREAEGHFRSLASPAFERFLAAANPASQERR